MRIPKQNLNRDDDNTNGKALTEVNIMKKILLSIIIMCA